ncbi:MAG: CoA transferase, partial [Chloroflexota bacterium]|nr:CoA transferase [Chloroflexota bacterium]
GKEIVYKSVASSDLFLENFRPGTTERLGMDYETIRKIKPDIVYVSLLGHGSAGPYRTFPGFDPLFQARSGIMVGQGGIGNQPVFLAVAINDYGGAMLGAYAAVLGLLVRARTGQGQHVETALTNSAAALQVTDFLDYKGKVHKNRGGVDLLGLNATCRLYETADKWIFVLCAKVKHWRSLCKVLGREELIADPRFKNEKARESNNESLVAILENEFARSPAAEWLDALEKAGVPCAPQLVLEDVLEDPHWLINELWAEHDHPELGRAKMTGLTAKLRETPGRIWRPAALLGQHTDQVLTELGYSQSEIADLRTKKVVA